jgi:hypothetical protein
MNSVVKVPRWLICKAWERGGERLSKREHLVEIIKSEPHTTYGFGTPKTRVSNTIDGNVPPYHVNNSHTIVLSDKTLMFDNWEYRFWAVDLINMTPQAAECRNCSKVFTNVTTRRKHGSEYGCFQLLVKAYEMLLRDRLCLICDQHTSHKVWGVPLCNNTSCLNTWMHLNAQPNALLEALTLLGQKSMESGT